MIVWRPASTSSNNVLDKTKWPWKALGWQGTWRTISDRQISGCSSIQIYSMLTEWLVLIFTWYLGLLGGTKGKSDLTNTFHSPCETGLNFQVSLSVRHHTRVRIHLQKTSGYISLTDQQAELTIPWPLFSTPLFSSTDASKSGLWSEFGDASAWEGSDGSGAGSGVQNVWNR